VWVAELNDKQENNTTVVRDLSIGVSLLDPTLWGKLVSLESEASFHALGFQIPPLQFDAARFSADTKRILECYPEGGQKRSKKKATIPDDVRSQARPRGSEAHRLRKKTKQLNNCENTTTQEDGAATRQFYS